MAAEGKQREFLDLLAGGAKYILVEAPAGTGKTYSCIQAAKCLWDNNMLMPYQKVLILTFSRNARAQLIKELSSLSPSDPTRKHIEINNYHSFFKKYLDVYRDILGISQPLSVVDDDDYAELLAAYLENQRKKLPKGLQSNIFDDFSLEDGHLILINLHSKFKTKKEKDIIRYIDETFRFTKNTGYICFAQFGALICKILQSSPSIAKAISHDYPVVILDEYQDTNYYQEHFVSSVLQKSCGIFFADRFQMIYEFRGSAEERLKQLPEKYPDLKIIGFTEYFRYKDKPDLVNLLTAIRSDMEFDYNKLINGKLLSRSVACDHDWHIKKGKSAKTQCSILSKQIFYVCIRQVSALLKKKKSVAILCRNNDVASRLAEVFFENNLYPRSVSDTNELLKINKLLKKCLDSEKLCVKIPVLLCIVALCMMDKKIDGESVETLITYSEASLSRKKKSIFKALNTVISPHLDSNILETCWGVLQKVLDVMNNESEQMINYPRKRFVEHCISKKELSADDIDKVMMQRQYIDSYTQISPGLYITTIHQSKGKEFDHVFVVDVDSIAKERNLLYVSHSRMKEALYPIQIQYLG